jgi:hypothetical protein
MYLHTSIQIIAPIHSHARAQTIVLESSELIGIHRRWSHDVFFFSFSEREGLFKITSFFVHSKRIVVANNEIHARVL